MERIDESKISFERFNKITFSSIESERRSATTQESLVKLTLKEDEEPITLQVQNQNHGDIYTGPVVPYHLELY
ncbi:putative lipid/polyisoprenoid-binding, YceI [Rosa chinensis]|uniref:Putative lipid/polyisoprenoid-binding, YceI n=1 Tax=Rosa chinensis TaxID=74649 RepID=A0A2P6PJ02_ROSCH|nr:putative lipid/polyisoprenoid-binding, YceI [Rosa chinensis]